MPTRKPFSIYLTPDQKLRWEAEAESRNMSLSEYLRAMIEAGRKKFSIDVSQNESNEELRRQRFDLREENTRLREQVSELESIAYQGEREVILEFITSNPGSTFPEMVQHVINTVPERVSTHLEDMDGNEVEVVEGRWYHHTEVSGFEGDTDG